MDRRKRGRPARASRWSATDGDWPEAAKPLPVEDGIKAHTKRGAFGQRWWAKRWIGVLEGFGLGPRLARGRNYARRGQVCEITIECGGVRAKVQGSRAQPYDVTIRMRELSPREWSAIGTAIAASARLSAMLLAGEMPEDIESAFASAGAALFPQAASELKMACSCPDWSSPCKHVAAVFYLVGEEFDRDPFLLFVVRGLERAAVRSMLTAPENGANQVQRPRRRRAVPGDGKRNATEIGSEMTAEREELDPASFWTGGSVARTHAAPGAPPKADAILVARAGRFPFWRSGVTLDEAVSPVYAQATQNALNWLAEHSEPEPEQPTRDGSTAARLKNVQR